MKLGKPPVVEVSVDFLFESAPSEPGWDYVRAADFVYQFSADYPETEVASQTQITEVQKLKRGTEPPLVGKNVPVAVRAFPGNRSRYLLNAKDMLQIMFVRTDSNDYPGFTALREEATKKVAAYIAYFRPAKMIAFVLRYVDFVRIPVVDGNAELCDYFTICREPDQRIFGQTVLFRKAFSTRPPDSQDLLTCELYNVPQAKEEAKPLIPFRMEWSVAGFKELTWDPPALEARLNDAHARLLHCFRNSFTERGWALFDPRDVAG